MRSTLEQKAIFRHQVDTIQQFLFNTRPTLVGQIAQLVEQRIENPRVGGSIPSLATILSLNQYVVSQLSHTGTQQWLHSENETVFGKFKFAVANTVLFPKLSI